MLRLKQRNVKRLELCGIERLLGLEHAVATEIERAGHFFLLAHDFELSAAVLEDIEAAHAHMLFLELFDLANLHLLVRLASADRNFEPVEQHFQGFRIGDVAFEHLASEGQAFFRRRR